MDSGERVTPQQPKIFATVRPPQQPTPQQAADTAYDLVSDLVSCADIRFASEVRRVQRNLLDALKVLEDAAKRANGRDDARLIWKRAAEWNRKKRIEAVARAEQAERKLGEASAVNAHAYEGLRQFAIAETARAETLTQALEEAHVLVVTASVAFGSPVVDEARQELWDKARARGWVVTEQDYTGDYQTRITGEGERALAAALDAATPNTEEQA